MTIRCKLCGCVPSIDKIEHALDLYFCSNPVLTKCPQANTEYTAQQWQELNEVKPDLFSIIYGFQSLSDHWQFLGLITLSGSIQAEWKLINSKGPVGYAILIEENDNIDQVTREAYNNLNKIYAEAVKQEHFLK